MQKFVNVHVDAEKGEGPAVAKKYGVNGFPTLVIVDADGAEIDRIVGFLPPDGFTKEIERILRGEGTIPALKQKVAANPDDLGAAADLAGKLAASDPKDALARYEALAAKAKGKDHEQEGRAWAGVGQTASRAGDPQKSADAYEKVLVGFGDTAAAKNVLRAVLFSRVGKDRDYEGALAYAATLRKKVKDGRFDASGEEVVASLHAMAAAQALERAAAAAGDDAQTLNRLAARAVQQRLSMPKAVEWARKAVDLTKREPAMLDTLANALFETGKFDEAVQVEQEALDKTTDARMKGLYDVNLAKFKAVVEARKAHGMTTGLPATPLADPKAQPPKVVPKVDVPGKDAPKAPAPPEAPAVPPGKPGSP